MLKENGSNEGKTKRKNELTRDIAQTSASTEYNSLFPTASSVHRKNKALLVFRHQTLLVKLYVTTERRL